jgi:thiamine biosynthesis lipoprotein
VSTAPAAAAFPALGSQAVVSVTQPGLLDEARTLLAADLDALDLACSRFRPDSELVRANAHAGERVRVSSLLAQALRVALQAAQASDGLVDPTLGAQLRAVGYDRTFTLVRERTAWRFVAAPAPTVSWRDVELDDERLLLLVPAGLELDLGATAKAWAADRAAARIAAMAGCGALVSLGGDVAVAGQAPAGGWPVRIAADHAAPLSGPGPVVAIVGGGLATSGTAVRRWKTDRGDAHHILDPRSGLPAGTPWSHVSVAGATCADANVAATAAVILGDAALDWLAARGLPARAVRHDGSIAVVGAWPDEARAA